MSRETFYPIIDIAGSSSEMGYQHGQQLRDRIRLTISCMRGVVGPRFFEESWADFRPTVDYCRQYAPDLIEEMEGIAEGAGVHFSDVFKISAHLDLLVWKRLVHEVHGDPDAGECSSHGVAAGDRVLLGWNGDDWRGWMDCGAVVRGRPSHAPPFIYWSLAGSVGRPGMNPHLALGANSLPSQQWCPDGLTYNIVCRKLLSCSSAEEARGLLTAHSRCASMNYLIAHRNGTLLNLETTPTALAAIAPTRSGATSYLLHTNSFLDSALAGGDVDPAACPRLAAARRLYGERIPTTVDGIRAVLSDHTGGVCVHRPEACTIVSFVADVAAGVLHVTRGGPCESRARTHALEPA